MDQGLHVLLHGGAGRRRDFVVLHADRTSRHLVQALVDDSERLAELLHTAKITIVAVTVDADGNVELDLVVGVIWLRLTDIPRNTRATEHDTSETHVESIGGIDNTNALGSGLPDTVVGKQLLSLIDTVTELGSPLVNIVQEAEGEILRHTTRANVGSVQTGSGNTLVEFLRQEMGVSRFDQCLPRKRRQLITYHEFLTLFEAPQERCQRTNIHCV